MEDEIICKFYWKVNDNVLLFSFDSLENQKNFLSESTIFNFKFAGKGDNKLEYLEISPKGQSTTYILSRTIL